MMRRARSQVAGLAALCLGMAVASGQDTALAAVRVCHPSHTGGQHTAASEIEARQATLAVCRKLAELHGPGYGAWRLAINKSLSCSRQSDGRYVCEAFGAPCVLQQVLEPGLKRVPKLQPGEPPPVTPAPARKATDI